MKILIFLSRVAFICNLFFLASVILRFVEVSHKVKVKDTGVIQSQWITSTIVVLGYSAIFLNAILFIAYLWTMVMGSSKTHGRWLMIANIIFFFIQIYYFFFL